MKPFILAFITMFIAELGDKTQIAIMSLSMKQNSPVQIWLGATLAFCILNFIAVIIGFTMSKFIPVNYLKYVSGTFFVIIGILTFITK